MAAESRRVEMTCGAEQETAPTALTPRVRVVERRRKVQGETKRRSKGKGKGKSERPQLVDLIANLIDGGFFKKPQDLASVKAALEEMGHHYPVTSLSPTMLRQVRKRNLRRLKKDKRWMYTR